MLAHFFRFIHANIKKNSAWCKFVICAPFALNSQLCKENAPTSSQRLMKSHRSQYNVKEIRLLTCDNGGNKFDVGLVRNSPFTSGALNSHQPIANENQFIG